MPSAFSVCYETPVNSENFLSVIRNLGDNSSPFLNHAWFFSWFNSVDISALSALYLMEDEKRIGAVVFGITKSAGLLPFKTALINQSACEKENQVWVEHNRLLCRDVHKRDFAQLCLQFLFYELSLTRIHVSMGQSKQDWLVGSVSKYTLYEDQKSYLLSLSSVKSQEDIVSSLSRNTRQKLRKAKRDVEKHLGALKIEVAKTRGEKLVFLSELAGYHIKQWGEYPQGSGFQNICFENFHTTLIKNNEKNCHLIRLKAGNTTAGLAYFLSSDKTIYFYCSGLQKNKYIDKFKVGYQLHVNAAEHFAKLGYETYDFLAGHSQYKRSLSTELYTMSNIEIITPCFRGKLFRSLRSVKKTLQLFSGSAKP